MLSRLDFHTKRACTALLSAAVLTGAAPVTAAQQSPTPSAQSQPQTPPPALTPEEQEMERLDEEGKQALNKADFPAAVKAFQTGLDRAEVITSNKYVARFLNGLGNVYGRLSQLDKALDYHRRALVLREKLGNLQDVARSLNNLGTTYYSLGQLDKALDYYNRALALKEKLGSPQDVATSLNNLGMLYNSLGRLDKALNYLHRALVLEEKLSNAPSIAASLGNLGTTYYSLGQLDKALDYYNRALVLEEKLGDSQGVAGSLNNLGTVYYSLGQLDKALDYDNRGLVLGEKLGNLQDVMRSLGNLGSTYYSLGQLDKALDYDNRGLVLEEKLGDPQDVATSLNNLGNVYDSLGQLDKALVYHRRALVLREKLGNLQDAATSLNNLGTTYYSLGQLDKAQAAFDRAIQQFESASEQVSDPDQVGAFQDTLNLYTNYALLRLRQQQPEKALALLERGRAQGLARQLAQSRVDYAAIFNAKDAARWRDINMERAIAGNLLGAAESRLQRATDHDKDIHKDKAAAPQQKADAAGEIKAAQTQRDMAKQRDEAAERQLSILRSEMRKQYPQFGALNQPRPLTSAQLSDLARHNPDTLYLQWAVTDDTTLLLALGYKDGVKGFRIPVKAKTLTQMALAWRNAIEANNENLSLTDQINLTRQSGGKSETDHARALFQTLFAPLQKAGLLAPGRYRRLVMVADGPLLDLPLAALVTDNDSKGRSKNAEATRLLDRCAVSTAISFGVLTWAGQPNGKAALPLFCVADTADTVPERFPRPMVENGAQIVASAPVIRDPPRSAPPPRVVGSLLRGGYGTLKEARKEGREIVGMFPGAIGLAGPLAHESDVQAAMARADVLHFAVHSILAANNPLRSWLLLAEEPQDSALDGRLEGREVVSMKLKARLTVLSACETGRGQQHGGDGLIGMAWAFRGAGCPCVVASQWRVDDTASHSLMTHFYRNLQNGQRKDEAMQRAMQAVRREKRHQSPLYWAGFEVIGDTTPLFISLSSLTPVNFHPAPFRAVKH